MLGLVSSWIAWWIILAAWGLGPAVPALMRVSGGGAHGSASLSFENGGLDATITEGSAVTWHGHASFLSFVLLVGVPPLVLWGLWLWTRKRPDAQELIGQPPAERVDVTSDAADRAR
jgi:hypothetical protein